MKRLSCRGYFSRVGMNGRDPLPTSNLLDVGHLALPSLSSTSSDQTKCGIKSCSYLLHSLMLRKIPKHFMLTDNNTTLV